jgi:hypothetical protein
MSEINRLIDEIPMLNRTQKDFYKHILWARYQQILVRSYERMKGHSNG